MVMSLWPTFLAHPVEVDSKLGGNIRTDGRTTRKRNYSGLICWMGGSIKNLACMWLCYLGLCGLYRRNMAESWRRTWMQTAWSRRTWWSQRFVRRRQRSRSHRKLARCSSWQWRINTSGQPVLEGPSRLRDWTDPVMTCWCTTCERTARRNATCSELMAAGWSQLLLLLLLPEM